MISHVHKCVLLNVSNKCNCFYRTLGLGFRLIGEFTPGKNGGRYEFPFGGQMTVDSGVVGNKRDVISCSMVSPSDRYKYVFELK